MVMGLHGLLTWLHGHAMVTGRQGERCKRPCHEGREERRKPWIQRERPWRDEAVSDSCVPFSLSWVCCVVYAESLVSCIRRRDDFVEDVNQEGEVTLSREIESF